ncbi:PepSY domain-containing protein [Sphingomonas sp. MMS24-JH45]
MKPIAVSLLLAGSLPTAAAPQPSEQERDGVAAWRAMRQGKLLPLREVERRVVPTMKDAQYIGFDLELPSGVYTLKFLKDGNVIWVDVDGRSGKIIGQTGR